MNCFIALFSRKLLLVFAFILSQQSFAQKAFNNEFYVYEDSTLQLNAQQALRLYSQQTFKKISDNQLNIGFTKSVYWLAYTNDCENSQNPLLLQIGNNQINRIDFYFVENDTPNLKYATGDHFLFSQRPLPTAEFNFPISKKGLYIARIDKHNESLQLSFKALPSVQAMKQEADETAFIALLSGMVLLMIIFGCFLSVMSKDFLYVLYVLYACAGWGYVIAHSGIGYEYLWPNIPWFASKARPLFSIITIALSLFFLEYYIGGLKQQFIRRIIHLVRYLLLGFALIMIIVDNNGVQIRWFIIIQRAVVYVTGAYVLFVIPFTIIQSRKGNKLAMFYLAATLVLLFMVALQIGFYSGSYNKKEGFFSQFGLATGYVVELIILTAGLTYRFNQFKLDKEDLLIEMNRQQVENTRNIMNVQEAERSQIANQLHDIAGSLLSAANLNLSSIREKNGFHSAEINYKLEKTEEAVSLVSESVRNLSHALSPVMLSKVGFKTSLEKIVSIFNASDKINITLVAVGFEKYNEQLSNYYTSLYSIVYELLNNTMKHSGAKNALVQVIEHEDCFSIVVEDDGIGIDPLLVRNKETHGLSGIVSKINYFKGTIAFDSNLPNGLIITIEIPRLTYAGKV